MIAYLRATHTLVLPAPESGAGWREFVRRVLGLHPADKREISLDSIIPYLSLKQRTRQEFEFLGHLPLIGVLTNYSGSNTLTSLCSMYTLL